jgi:CheY-like chemotaxis protein
MAALALVDVTDIVEWLRDTEARIGLLYARAAEACSEDAGFSAFLRGLSEDEKAHAGFMSWAGEQLHHRRTRPPLDILLDARTQSMVEELLQRFERLLTRTPVAKKDVIEYLARAEASELNPIFLYVAGESRRAGREGERMTGEIQAHLRRIQLFLDDLPSDQRPSINVSTLPVVGEKRFLVVEDRGPLRKLLASLLARRGTVDTAGGGHEGLEKLREHFHDGIVAGVQMPRMDGLELYRRAVEYDPRLSGRFLFCSGSLSRAREKYLTEHNLPYLHKPFGLTEFQAAMDGILAGDRKKPGESSN